MDLSQLVCSFFRHDSFRRPNSKHSAAKQPLVDPLKITPTRTPRFFIAVARYASRYAAKFSNGDGPSRTRYEHDPRKEKLRSIRRASAIAFARASTGHFNCRCTRGTGPFERTGILNNSTGNERDFSSWKTDILAIDRQCSSKTRDWPVTRGGSFPVVNGREREWGSRVEEPNSARRCDNNLFAADEITQGSRRELYARTKANTLAYSRFSCVISTRALAFERERCPPRAFGAPLVNLRQLPSRYDWLKSVRARV